MRETRKRVKRLNTPIPDCGAGKLVWIHAVSVGEGAAALPLISKILERAPETNILVTGGTLAAEEWRRYRYPGSVIRQVREAAQHACKGIQNFKR